MISNEEKEKMKLSEQIESFIEKGYTVDSYYREIY